MSKIDISNQQGIIYRFKIDGGLFYYVGQTKLTMEERFKQHRTSCLGLDERHIDNSKKYVIMRKLGINAENWTERVKCKVIKVCRLDEIDYYENLNIDLGAQSLNTQHSLKYLDGYYTKTYYQRGAYTPLERKQRVLETASKWNKEQGVKYLENMKQWAIKNKGKFKCECCGYETYRISLLKNHCKSKKHKLKMAYQYWENVD